MLRGAGCVPFVHRDWPQTPGTESAREGTCTGTNSGLFLQVFAQSRPCSLGKSQTGLCLDSD
jgi:hypothetical protein